jgi:hypothetical protein
MKITEHLNDLILFCFKQSKWSRSLAKCQPILEPFFNLSSNCLFLFFQMICIYCIKDFLIQTMLCCALLFIAVHPNTLLHFALLAKY